MHEGHTFVPMWQQLRSSSVNVAFPSNKCECFPKQKSDLRLFNLGRNVSNLKSIGRVSLKSTEGGPSMLRYSKLAKETKSARVTLLSHIEIDSPFNVGPKVSKIALEKHESRINERVTVSSLTSHMKTDQRRN